MAPTITAAHYDDQGDTTGDLHLTFDQDMDQTSFDGNGFTCLLPTSKTALSNSVGIWADARHYDQPCYEASPGAPTSLYSFNGNPLLKSAGSGTPVAAFSGAPFTFS